LNIFTNILYTFIKHCETSNAHVLSDAKQRIVGGGSPVEMASDAVELVFPTWRKASFYNKGER
jgi:hypothetical protein